MILDDQMSGIEDWLTQAESTIKSAARVRDAYKNATAKPKPVIVQQGLFSGGDPVNLDRTMMLYLAAGAVAAIALFMALKK